jgi:hypothetical protein
VQRLRTFWERITERKIWNYTPDGDVFRRTRNAASSWLTILLDRDAAGRRRDRRPRRAPGRVTGTVSEAAATSSPAFRQSTS